MRSPRTKSKLKFDVVLKYNKALLGLELNLLSLISYNCGDPDLPEVNMILDPSGDHDDSVSIE